MERMAKEPPMTSASLARQALQQVLEEGRWQAGEKLPAERERCEILGVKRMSLRQALLALEHEGAIFRLDRRGWYVAQPRYVSDSLSHVGFERMAREQGEASWQDLEQEVIEADVEQAADFGLDPGEYRN